MYSTLQNYFITYFDEVSTDGRAGIIFCCFWGELYFPTKKTVDMEYILNYFKYFFKVPNFLPEKPRVSGCVCNRYSAN